MNNPNMTIIYYTANREDEKFEQQIIDGINKVKGDLPVISVSQKPLDFGKNICVGDVGYSYYNAFRQLLIGCKEATTDFVIMAEADCLYPITGYFDFKPTDTDIIYTYDNVWIVWDDIEKFSGWKKKDLYHKKDMTHASLIIGRKKLIAMLEKAFEGKPDWSTEIKKFSYYPENEKLESFHGDGIVCFKTKNATRSGTKLEETPPPQESIWYWGNCRELKQKVFGYEV